MICIVCKLFESQFLLVIRKNTRRRLRKNGLMDGLDVSRRRYNVKTGEIIAEGDRARAVKGEVDRGYLERCEGVLSR